MAPWALAGLSIVLLTVLFARRQWALLAMIGGALYITMAQGFHIAGFNMYALRFIELAVITRVTLRREFSFRQMNKIDWSFLILYVYSTLVFVLRSSVGQANQIGMAVDALISYFAFRGLVKTPDDFKWFLSAFLLLLIPYVPMVLYESYTSYCFFEHGIYSWVWERGTRYRAFGSFGHPILLGTLGTSFLPIYIGVWFSKPRRMFAAIGIGLCLALVWASNSGSPLSCMLVGVIAWMLWAVRTQMRWVRRGFVALILMLAAVMKAPIWFLLSRVSDVSGGTGWHRSELIDAAVRHAGQWWLAGMPIKDTAGWLPYFLDITGGVDMTNNYLAFGMTAGLVAVFLFVLLLTRACGNLGKAMAVLRTNAGALNSDEYLCWGLGAMLVVHIVNWLGTTYFDQTYFIWFMQLAAISSITQHVMASKSGLEGAVHPDRSVERRSFALVSGAKASAPRDPFARPHRPVADARPDRFSRPGDAAASVRRLSSRG